MESSSEWQSFVLLESTYIFMFGWFEMSNGFGLCLNNNSFANDKRKIRYDLFLRYNEYNFKRIENIIVLSSIKNKYNIT